MNLLRHDFYKQNLIKLPKHLSECEEILQFFEVEPDDLDPPKPYSGVERWLSKAYTVSFYLTYSDLEKASTIN